MLFGKDSEKGPFCVFRLILMAKLFKPVRRCIFSGDIS